MTGSELFDFYQGYAQTLSTAEYLFGREKLFPILEQCEKEGKFIELRTLPGYEGVYDPPLRIVMVDKKTR